MPNEVHHILNTLNSAGYEAYVVGGCIRDSIMQKSPQDWDIATSAAPDKVKSLFEKTIDTGIQHGTVTVNLNHTNYEITTFRVDGDYLNHRRPEAVHFTSSLIEDLKRRDFTINAMAYHPEIGLIDEFNGLKDIQSKTIKTVGEPSERFNEDALRMLRAIRFSAQLSFEIAPDTLKSIKDCCSLVESISSERIRDELDKILLSDNPLSFLLLSDTGLLHFILPEFELSLNTAQRCPYHIYNVGLHSLHAAASIQKDRLLRWALLLHDIGKPYVQTTDTNGVDHFYGHPAQSVKQSETILKRLKFDNKSIDSICRLIAYHDRIIAPNPKSVRKAVKAIGKELFPDLLKIKEADSRAQNLRYLDDRLHGLAEIQNIYQTILDENQCTSIKDLAINGEDLLKLGFKRDKTIGNALDILMEMVLEHPEWNVREKLLEEAQKIKLRV